MISHGFEPQCEVVADGRIHRFKGPDDHRENAWFILWGEPRAAGVFGSWRTGERFIWSERTTPGDHWTPARSATLRRELERARQRRVRERESAEFRAAAIWARSYPASPNHPYLLKKHIQPHSARQLGERLVIAMQNEGGWLRGLQFIFPSGDKRFVKGQATTGLYFVLGEITDKILVTEGFATAASCFEATGIPTACAFSAGNLLAVCKALQSRHPKAEITLCADRDPAGLQQATLAARAVKGKLAVPEPPYNDFNDQHVAELATQRSCA